MDRKGNYPILRIRIGLANIDGSAIRGPKGSACREHPNSTLSDAVVTIEQIYTLNARLGIRDQRGHSQGGWITTRASGSIYLTRARLDIGDIRRRVIGNEIVGDLRGRDPNRYKRS